MTSPRQPDEADDALFIADFYPRLGAWLARQHARGYDAVAGRARFVLWLAAHTDASALTDHLARAARNQRLSAGEESELLARIATGRRARDKLAEEGDALSGEARASLRRIAQDGDQARDRLLEANLWQAIIRAMALSPSPAPEPGTGAGDSGQLTLADRWLRQVLGREPTAEELAAELDLPPSAPSRPSPGPSRDRDL